MITVIHEGNLAITNNKSIPNEISKNSVTSGILNTDFIFE